MQVTKITDDRKGRIDRFLIWVWARHAYDFWKEMPYAFQYDGRSVYFLVGGQEKGKKFVSNALTREEAIGKATEYLEAWLRECVGA